MGQTTGETVHHLELDIGSIRVAMKRHGLEEPIPCKTSSIPIESHRTYHGPDGTLTTNIFDSTDFVLVLGTVTLEDIGSQPLAAVSIRLD